jgi:hypothetical protein
MGPKGPWIVDGGFGPPLFERDFAVGHLSSGVTSQFGNFVSLLSNALLRTILLIFRVIQFTAALHAGSLVSYHHFPNFLLYFNKWYCPRISYFRSEIVIFYPLSEFSLYNLEADATENTGT